MPRKNLPKIIYLVIKCYLDLLHHKQKQKTKTKNKKQNKQTNKQTKAQQNIASKI